MCAGCGNVGCRHIAGYGQETIGCANGNGAVANGYPIPGSENPYQGPRGLLPYNQMPPPPSYGAPGELGIGGANGLKYQEVYAIQNGLIRPGLPPTIYYGVASPQAFARPAQYPLPDAVAINGATL